MKDQSRENSTEARLSDEYSGLGICPENYLLSQFRPRKNSESRIEPETLDTPRQNPLKTSVYFVVYCIHGPIFVAFRILSWI